LHEWLLMCLCVWPVSLTRDDTRGEGFNLAFTRYCHHRYCIVYGIKGVGGGGGVYHAMAVQKYCNRVGFAGGGRHTRRIDFFNIALK